MPKPRHQQISFLPFARAIPLRASLELAAPVLTEAARETCLSQLEYVERYVEHLGCQTVVLESHYIDRDYIEDHSLFYSRSLYPYANWCRRLHFFRGDPQQTRRRLTALEDLCSSPRAETREIRSREFSNEYYLGFTVIKPLHGSPVGRTVLKCWEPTPDDAPQERRTFPGARRYTVHLGAVALEVTGLPFQEQDVGVSACATTALWSALHKLRESEEIGSPTPAQITTLATQYSLPNGRPIPSDEGLSLDQMCQALQALSVAPSLLRVSAVRGGPNDAPPAQEADEFLSFFSTTRAYIHTALRSGFAPVLVLESADDSEMWHAVTAVGYRHTAKSPNVSRPYDLADDVHALYVHDDRIGPYERVDIFEVRSGGRPSLGVQAHRNADTSWHVRYVLVPMHAKIRISVSDLRRIAGDLIMRAARIYKEARRRRKSRERPRGFTYETRISRPAAYLEELLAAPSGHSRQVARQLIERVAMPRYVGIVRLSGPSMGVVDLLVDTTSTMKNLHFLAIAHYGDAADPQIWRSVAEEYRCDVLGGLALPIVESGGTSGGPMRAGLNSKRSS